MPGKVNPVIPESVCQVAAQVIGNDAAIAVAGQSGNFEINVMMPVAAYNLLQSIDLLAASARNLARQCVRDLEATTAGPDMVDRGTRHSHHPRASHRLRRLSRHSQRSAGHRPDSQASRASQDRPLIRRTRRHPRPLRHDRTRPRAPASRSAKIPERLSAHPGRKPLPLPCSPQAHPAAPLSAA